MADPEHLRILKQGVKVFNEWREENPVIEPNLIKAVLEKDGLIRANLFGANLHGANLHGADLRGANLQGANLRRACLYGADLQEADLQGADIRGVDFLGANLYRADLCKANLSEADLYEHDLSQMDLSETNLSEANLEGTNLSYSDLSHSDISGADITGAIIHDWKIEGIKCTHIFWKGKRIDYTNPDDFEKAFTKIESVVSMLLDITFSDLGYYTGRIIEYEINRKYAESSLILRGHSSISDCTTKLEFLSFTASDDTDEIKGKLKELQGQLNLVIEDFKANTKSRSPMGVKDEVEWQDLVYPKFLILKPKEMELVIKERNPQMHSLLQNIVQTIQLYIR